MKNFKLLTKAAIIGYILLVSVRCVGQDYDKIVFVEITDTVEIAYDLSWGRLQPWDGYEVIKDSIGVDSVRVFKLYTKIEGCRVYLDVELRKYPHERKGVDNRFSGQGYAY